jgi:hypothetical protein
MTAPRRFTSVLAVLAVLAALLAVPGRTAHAATLLSLNKPATASSTESAAFPATAAVDGDTGTRWSSAFSDPQWLRIDLGETRSISQVVLSWEAAYGTAFQIQVSGDGSTWTTIYSTTAGTGGTQTLDVTGNGRYIRLYGTARATGYGYSLWEFSVYGDTGTEPPPPGTTPISAFKQVAASSWEGGNAPAAALDGRTTTRWSSEFSDDQWLRVDLGGTAAITGVTLDWEAAYATGYRLDVSADGTTWTTVYSTTTGKGGTERLAVSGTGRYIRFTGTKRATGYGYSLWEFQVFGSVDSSSTAPPLLSPPTTRWSRTPGVPPSPGRASPAPPATRCGSTSAAPTTTSPRPARCWTSTPRSPRLPGRATPRPGTSATGGRTSGTSSR